MHSHQAQLPEGDDLDGLRRGDPAAAGRLIDRFCLPLIRYFSVNLPDRSLAEDMAQEVFLRLVRMVRRGAAEQVRSPSSLVFTIARNLVVDLHRAARTAPRWEPLEADTSSETPGGPPELVWSEGAPNPRDNAIASEEAAMIESALQTLPDDMREVIVLRHVEGLNGREIAAILGVAEGTVWSRLNRGMVELKRSIEGRSRAPVPGNPRDAEGGEA
jgi:RNA polymerase sigma factor (sigma-70 family)